MKLEKTQENQKNTKPSIQAYLDTRLFLYLVLISSQECLFHVPI